MVDDPIRPLVIFRGAIELEEVLVLGLLVALPVADRLPHTSVVEAHEALPVRLRVQVL